MLEAMRKTDKCGIEKFGTLLIDNCEMTIGNLGDTWRPKKAKQEGDKMTFFF